MTNGPPALDAIRQRKTLSMFSESQDEFDLRFRHRLADSTGLD